MIYDFYLSVFYRGKYTFYIKMGKMNALTGYSMTQNVLRCAEISLCSSEREVGICYSHTDIHLSSEKVIFRVSETSF